MRKMVQHRESLLKRRSRHTLKEKSTLKYVQKNRLHKMKEGNLPAVKPQEEAINQGSKHEASAPRSRETCVLIDRDLTCAVLGALNSAERLVRKVEQLWEH